MIMSEKFVIVYDRFIFFSDLFLDQIGLISSSHPCGVWLYVHNTTHTSISVADEEHWIIFIFYRADTKNAVIVPCRKQQVATSSNKS